MSTITVTNIKATGETASREVSGVAAAWVNFNGTGTIAARDSVNVASLTDNGTGTYGISFSNSFANSNFMVAALTGISSGSADIRLANSSPLTTSSINLLTVNGDQSSLQDNDQVHSAAHGDLA